MSKSEGGGCGCLFWIVVIIVAILVTKNIKEDRAEQIQKLEDRIEHLEHSPE